MVGAVRFELTTSCTRNKRASQATLRPDAEPSDCQPRPKKQWRFFEPDGPTAALIQAKKLLILFS